MSKFIWMVSNLSSSFPLKNLTEISIVEMEGEQILRHALEYNYGSCGYFEQTMEDYSQTAQ